jgi:hypothetical protein
MAALVSQGQLDLDVAIGQLVVMFGMDEADARRALGLKENANG